MTAMTSMTSSYPLLTHPSLDRIAAWSHGRPVTVRTFLADVGRLAARLPAGGHVFNACADRYRFAVGLCAALVAGKTSLLPSAHTAAMVRQLLDFAPDTVCLHDADTCAFAMPQVRYDDGAEAGEPANDLSVPHIPASRVMAHIFTSGSTGQPVAHAKTWGAMVRGARAAAARLGLDDGRDWSVVGTVPPQHMFGVEATVMLALQSGAALTAAPAFYPADIAAALDTVPSPRALMTSPVHLRALMQAGLSLPPADLTVSATAPLGAKLADEAEAQLGGHLLEIYGSTETGAIATRRTVAGETWQLMPGVTLDTRAARDPDNGTETWADGAQIDAPVPLGDAIESLDATHFLLHGRKADLIKIAGKRTSLAWLNHQLTSIDGVADGAFYMPDDAHEGDTEGHVVRLAALVVAPDVPLAAIRRALRERVDAAFVPRPLLRVDRLPRNATGKLPRDVLAPLVARLLAERQRPGFIIGADHPAMPGHFPGHPVVPGVVLLDHAVLRIGAVLGRPLSVSHVGTVKFLSPVAPGERVSVWHDANAAQTGAAQVRFTLTASGRDVASGTLTIRPVTEALPC